MGFSASDRYVLGPDLYDHRLTISGVMLSLARSRLAIPTQLLFLGLNGCGLFFGIFYNVNTPDLYANNIHHKIGWFATCVVTAQLAMSLLFGFSGSSKKEQDTAAPAERAVFLPISTGAMAQHQHLYNPHGYKDIRWSGDSGQGTERASSSLHSRDRSINGDAQRQEEYKEREPGDDYDDDDDEEEGQIEMPTRQNSFGSGFMHRVLKLRVPRLSLQRVLKVSEAIYDGIDRIILVLGFIALVTGGVTYAGIFVSRNHFRYFHVKLTLCSAATMSSMALPTSSKVAYSSGTASSHSDVGRDVLPILAGHGISSRANPKSELGKLPCRRPNSRNPLLFGCMVR
jgi:Domain of unknown function (DUF2427)